MLAEALAGRASFRRFCGLAREEATPERPAFVRFRRQLVAHGLAQSLVASITRALEQKGAFVRKGTPIDATVIASASKGDKEAAWGKHKSRPPMPGDKAHIRAGKETGMIRAVETTPANAAAVSVAPSLLPDRPGEANADRAYDALAVEKAIEAKGGLSQLMRKGHRWLPAKKLAMHNRPLRRVRSRIATIFGTWKRTYRLRHMRWIGLVKATRQGHRAAIAYNVKRLFRLQSV